MKSQGSMCQRGSSLSMVSASLKTSRGVGGDGQPILPHHIVGDGLPSDNLDVLSS